MLFKIAVPDSHCISISVSVFMFFMAGISSADVLAVPVAEMTAKELEPVSAHSLSPSREEPDKITGTYLRGYISDTGNILASPTRWDSRDWLKAGLTIGTTAGLLFTDTEIRNIAQRNHGLAEDKAATIGNMLGNPFYALPSLGIFYLYGSIREDSKARRVSLLAAESLTISCFFATTIKQTAQRYRPSTGETSDSWNGPRTRTADYSFPSIHTATAFSIASVLAEEYRSPFVAPVAYGFATLTGLSRIYDNKHWASDVFFGGVIGYFVGKTIVRYHASPSHAGLFIVPVGSRHGGGLTAEYRF